MASARQWEGEHLPIQSHRRGRKRRWQQRCSGGSQRRAIKIAPLWPARRNLNPGGYRSDLGPGSAPMPGEPRSGLLGVNRLGEEAISKSLWGVWSSGGGGGASRRSDKCDAPPRESRHRRGNGRERRLNSYKAGKAARACEGCRKERDDQRVFNLVLVSNGGRVRKKTTKREREKEGARNMERCVTVKGRINL